MFKLIDNYNRVFSYLRLSVIDSCNFNCVYCLPEKNRLKDNILSLNEISNLVSVFVYLGVNKIRLTGGEPTLRKDFLDIGSNISSYKSIRSLVFTTNGYRLNKIAKQLKSSGFSGVNISLDSLDFNKFSIITNRNYYNKVIDGIFESLSYGLNVKLNVVLSNFFTFFDFENFYSLLKYKNLTVRFIDQMETGSIKKSYTYLSSFYISSFLERNGWIKSFPCDASSGPAVLFENVNFLGKIGFINPYSKSFCVSCNRLRVSSNGDLFLCLFGGIAYPLKCFLDNENKKYDLLYYILDKIKFKHSSHFLHDDKFGLLKSFSSIGG